MVIEFEKILGQIQSVPWRILVIILTASFVLATLVANVVSYLLMPSFTPSTAGSKSDEFSEMSSQSSAQSLMHLTLNERDLKAIYDRNIFNRDGTLGDVDETSEGDDKAGEAIKSELPVRVLGIIYGGTPFNGLATIENTQLSKINSFVVGDMLTKDATIVEIHRTRVYLQRGKRREYVELENKEIVRNSRQKKTTSTSSNASGGVAPIALGAPPSKFREDGFEREGTEMVMSQEYRQRMILGDLTKVLQDAKAVPNMVDGQIKGFKLERIREGSIYQKAGFQNGDIVEEINGVQLNNPGNAIKLLQQLRNENEIETVVNRGGARITQKLVVR